MTLKILVLDDEPGVGRVFERAFRKDADVLATTSPEAALALAKDGTFDVIICDFHMPRVSGADFFALLAEQNSGLEKKIIFITGGLYSEESQMFIDSIDNPVIYKPFELTELNAAMEQITGSVAVGE